MQDIDELYSKKLVAKSLASLSNYKQDQQRKQLLNQLANQYYLEHAGLQGKKNAYDALVSFAIYSKQSHNAKM